MFDLLSLSGHDLAMISTGGVTVAAGLVVVGLVSKAAPPVKAWLTKEKTTLLALEDKMKSGFGFAGRAIGKLQDEARAGDAKLRADFDAVSNVLHGDAQAAIARIEQLEIAVFGTVKNPPASPTAAELVAAIPVPAAAVAQGNTAAIGLAPKGAA